MSYAAEEPGSFQSHLSEIEGYRRTNRELNHQVANLREKLERAERELKRANMLIDFLCQTIERERGERT